MGCLKRAQEQATEKYDTKLGLKAVLVVVHFFPVLWKKVAYSEKYS
jgi:hypothetical protein